MTLKDIAKAAGVSVSTVSRVLNDKDTKSACKDTRDRVWKIVRENGYILNTDAQRLRKLSEPQKSDDPEKHYYACIYARSRDNKDMFFSELANSIEHEAYKKNYILKYSFFANDLEERVLADIVSSKDISGIIVLGRFDQERLDAIADSKKNLVYVGLNFTSNRHDTVFCDGFKAGVKAMETLLELGHTDIAYIGELKRESRYRAYDETLTSHKLNISKNLIVDAKQTLDGGYRGAKELLSRASRFTAIFCANDATAMGAIKAIKENGLSIPNDISIISIDDVEMARYITPMLTTVHIPISELGRMAAKILIDRIENGHSLPVKVELPFSLAKRESCALFKP